MADSLIIAPITVDQLTFYTINPLLMVMMLIGIVCVTAFIGLDCSLFMKCLPVLPNLLRPENHKNSCELLFG